MLKKRVYEDQEIIHISKDGKVTREKPGYIVNFDIRKKEIYESSIAIRDIGGAKKGETWTSEEPFKILGDNTTLPYYPSFLEKLFGARPIRKQKVIFASKTDPIATYPTNLILAEDFYMMYRPTLGFYSISIFVGKRTK